MQHLRYRNLWETQKKGRQKVEKHGKIEKRKKWKITQSASKNRMKLCKESNHPNRSNHVIIICTFPRVLGRELKQKSTVASKYKNKA